MNFIKQILLGLLLLPLGMQMHGQNCVPDIVVSTPITSGSVQLIQADNSVTGTSSVQSGAEAVFKAGLEVNLEPGFDAFPGAIFDGVIGNCTSSVTIPNDPYFSWQWGHYNTGAVPIYDFGVPVPNRTLGGTVDADADILEAWEITKGSPNITVAILDYGVDLLHPDISPTRLVHGYNFADNNSNVQDVHGHGTLVTGILAATPNNGIGTAGIDWNCKVMPLKTHSPSGIAPPETMVAAVEHAILYGADILNMSFGGSGLRTQIEEDVYRKAIDSGMLLFASSGNDNAGVVDYPARYPSIVGVGALGPCNERKSSVLGASTGSCDRDNRADGTLHWGSNYGDGLDFVAPGTLLPSTDPVSSSIGYSQYSIYQSDATGSYVFDSYGTSMSSPFAAGVASLVWGLNPSLKNYQVKYILQQSAVAVGGVGTGAGSINARAAVEMAQTFNPNQDYLLPNLSLELGASSPSVNINSTLSIPYVIRNTGDAQAGSSQMSFRTIYNSTPIVIPIPPLNVQQFVSGTIQFPVTSNCNGGVFEEGDYTLEISIDPQNQVEEFNEFNDYEREFEVLGAPDLVPENVSFVNNSLTFDVRNIGTTKAKLTCIPSCVFFRFYWSSDAVPSSNDVFVNKYESVFSWCPQDITSHQINLVPPGNPNYLIVVVDFLGAVPESNETNNVYAIQLNNSAGKSGRMASAESGGYPVEVFPNPLHENGTVSYTLESTNEVSVAIYDILGVKVQNLLPKVVQGKGSYEIPFQKAGLTSGIYMVEVSIDGKKYLEKLVVQ